MNNARTIFEKFDSNQNGFIDVNELEKVSTELGEAFTLEDIEKVKNLVIGTEEGISFSNFIIWWKLGKQNSFALKTLITLEELASKISKEKTKYLEGIREDLAKAKNDEDNLSNHHLRLYSGNPTSSPGLQLLFDLFLGNEKKDACINYLKQWTTNFNSANGIFIDLNFQFDETVDGKEAKRIIDEKLEMLMGVLQILPDILSIIKTFFIIETYANQNSGKLTFRLKVDAEGLLRKHLRGFFSLLDIFHDVSQHFQVNLKSKASPKQIYQNNLNGFQIFKDFEADLNIKLMRDHLRLLASKLPKELKQAFYVLTAPTNLDLTVKVDPERAAGPRLRPILETPMGFIGEMVKMVPLEMIFSSDTATIKKIKEVQIALNSYHFFTAVKIYLEGIFDS
jgi:hypothetical protein